MSTNIGKGVGKTFNNIRPLQIFCDETHNILRVFGLRGVLMLRVSDDGTPIRTSAELQNRFTYLHVRQPPLLSSRSENCQDQMTMTGLFVRIGHHTHREPARYYANVHTSQPIGLPKSLPHDTVFLTQLDPSLARVFVTEVGRANNKKNDGSDKNTITARSRCLLFLARFSKGLMLVSEHE
uniref:Uncharacterized protein n=1 Tax=Lygus hesperus TaxID=30085 RepID=A0A146L4U7_LYGHE